MEALRWKWLFVLSWNQISEQYICCQGNRKASWHSSSFLLKCSCCFIMFCWHATLFYSGVLGFVMNVPWMDSWHCAEELPESSRGHSGWVILGAVVEETPSSKLSSSIRQFYLDPQTVLPAGPFNWSFQYNCISKGSWCQEHHRLRTKCIGPFPDSSDCPMALNLLKWGEAHILNGKLISTVTAR